MQVELEELDAYIKTKLLPEHYERSQYVVKLLLMVANTYSLNENHARLAGLLHLVSRQMKTEEMISFVAECEDTLAQRLPQEYWTVFHLTGPASARFAYEVLDERSYDVYRALREHTFLYKDTTILAKCLYVASILAAADQNNPKTAVLLCDFMAGRLEMVLRTLSKRDVRSLQKTSTHRLARISNPDHGDIG